MADSEKDGKRLVLLVEDDNFLCDLFAKKVSATFEVIVSSSGEEAIKLAAERLPEVILLDLNLPDGNGFEILKKIRQIEALKSAVVIILTNSVAGDDALKSSELQADDYMTKANFSLEEIIERIEKLLEAKTQTT